VHSTAPHILFLYKISSGLTALRLITICITQRECVSSGQTVSLCMCGNFSVTFCAGYMITPAGGTSHSY